MPEFDFLHIRSPPLRFVGLILQRVVPKRKGWAHTVFRALRMVFRLAVLFRYSMKVNKDGSSFGRDGNDFLFEVALAPSKGDDFVLAACGENDDEEGFEPLGFAQDALSDDEFGLINRDGVTVLDVADFGFGREECVEVPFPYGWVLDLHQSFRARVREDHFKETSIHGRGAVRGFPNWLERSQNVLGGDLTQPLLPKEWKGEAADFAFVDRDGVFRAVAANVGDFGDGGLAKLLKSWVFNLSFFVRVLSLQPWVDAF